MLIKRVFTKQDAPRVGVFIPCGVFDFGSPVYYFFKLVIGLCLGGDARNPHILS